MVCIHLKRESVSKLIASSKIHVPANKVSKSNCDSIRNDLALGAASKGGRGPFSKKGTVFADSP